MSNDVQVDEARDLHEEARHTQFKLDRIRQRRNEIIRELRTHNPKRWSYTALAKATGMPKELIAAIVQGRTS
jgi:seryl-tRNA synthetase